MKHMVDMIRGTYLQFDPGEGAGGAGGAGTGAAGGPGEGQTGGAEAPQQRRRSKGEDLSGVVYGIQTQEQPDGAALEGQQPGPDDGAAETQQQRTSFRDLIHSDEYKAEADEYIGNIVRDRLKGAKAQEALLGKAQATMERIAQRYNMDASDLGSLDFDKLNAAIDGDEIYLNERAALNGVTVDVQRQLDEGKRLKMTFERQQRENESRRAFDAIIQQAEQFKTVVPGFDLSRELQNPAFLQMVRPPQMGGSGVSVEQAYFALHHKEMMGAGMQAAAQQAKQAAVSTIQAGKARPVENGATTTRTVDVRADPRKLKKADYEEIFRQAAAGKKISF